VAAASLAESAKAQASVLYPVTRPGSFDRLADRSKLPAGLTARELRLPDLIDDLPDGNVIAATRSGYLYLMGPDGRRTKVPRPVDKAYGDGDPLTLTAAPDGSLVIADESAVWRRIRGQWARIDPKRRAFITAISPLPDGAFAVADRATADVLRLEPDGAVSTLASAVPTAAMTAVPDGLLSAGTDGVVRAVTYDGHVRPWAPASDLSHVVAVAALAGGAVAVADARAGVLRIGPDGIRTRVVRTRSGVVPYRTGRALDHAVVNGPIGAVVEDPLGGLLVLGADGLLLVPSVGSRRQAIAIAPETLRLAQAGRAMIHTTLGGRTRVQLIRGGRVVAARTLAVRPGRTVLELPGPRASRVHTLTVAVETADGRTSADMLAIVPGRRLHPADAAQTIEEEVLVDDGDSGFGARAQRCRRIRALRVRCGVILFDAGTGLPPSRSVRAQFTVDLFVDGAGRPRVRGTSRTRDRSRTVIY
jgi:hypothetical protein